MSKPSKGPSGKHHRKLMKETFGLGKPTWTQKDVPDQTGKVIIVTGGSSGLGKATVETLLEKGAKVYILARSEQKATACIEELQKQTGKTALFIKVELASLKSVHEAVEEFKSKEAKLDVLYNNAGIMLTSELTPEGFDYVFQTNVTGPFYLTQLLFPLLEFTATTASKGEVRIINLSSCAHHIARQNPIQFEALSDTPIRQKYRPEEYYSMSKFANIIVSNEFAKRGAGKNVVSIAVHPGSFETPLTSAHRSKFGVLVRLYLDFVFSRCPYEYGPITQLWAGTAPEAAEMNGKYIIPWGKAGKPRPEVHDETLSAELKSWLEARVASYEATREAPSAPIL
ncbi:hypothetical protein BKA70DRAFT_768583 [Coprinopsis sp. MPI-PUGE-AT-0042]|nr:hypothetical protein BKA70DRAFT_768583 [Coprinopsis sp. MPI-PUGE-AT-0042]